MWTGWVAFYDYFRAIGILKNEQFDQYCEYLECGGTFTVVFKNLAITSNRPLFVKQDETARLHCDSGPAIKWRDGFELFFLDGVELSADLYTQVISQQMTFDEIIAIEDADIRAVALKYNKNAIIASGAELIDDHPQFGELFLIKDKPINDLLDEKELYFMRMQCPTGRTFVECADPVFAKKNPYILNCQANAFGVPVEIYQQLQPRNEG